MVYLSTLEEWQKQSALLLQARPSTTRVTTKYNIPNLSSAKYQQSNRKEQDDKHEAEKNGEAQPRVPRATITLKTYDPVSGIVLKFKTDRAADVGRTIAGLGTLGRHMAALPKSESKMDILELNEQALITVTAKDITMEDATAAEPAKPTNDVNPSAELKAPVQTSSSSGAGKKKKKKGNK